MSCGQRDEQERQLARRIAELLANKGFDPYVAIEVQTVFEINSRLLRHLKDSDCYLFVNLRRERLEDGSCRGSLFSHQEFAIAFALGFENILVVNQRGVASEGMLGCLASNTDEFENFDDCLAVLDYAIGRSGWQSNYSRRLSVSGLRFSKEPIGYGQLAGHFLYLDVHNHRSDIAALETTGRLFAYAAKEMPWHLSEVRSPLKATGRPGFSHTIFPNSYEAFDLLCVGLDRRVYLNTALDVRPVSSLPITQGTWDLTFEFFAVDFPVLTVGVELTIEDSVSPSARLIDFLMPADG